MPDFDHLLLWDVTCTVRDWKTTSECEVLLPLAVYHDYKLIVRLIVSSVKKHLKLSNCQYINSVNTFLVICLFIFRHSHMDLM